MNGSAPPSAQHSPLKKPPPTGPAPTTSLPTTPSPRLPPLNNSNTTTPVATNGNTSWVRSDKIKKKSDPTPPDPVTMYESVRNRIAALEEEEVHGEEEEKRIAEEARRSVKGVSDSVIQAKYIDLFQEMKRVERDHAKEKQKLTRDKDAAKSQLTKANQSKTKLENLARELQKDNKKLREDSKRLTTSVEEAQDVILSLKNEMERRAEKSKKKEKSRLADSNSPNSLNNHSGEMVLKVVCRYRAELFFKISRKTKLSRLFTAWGERMESQNQNQNQNQSNGGVGGGKKSEGKAGKAPMAFLFTHLGRNVEADQTPEDAGMEDGDEILAVEIMDLTKDAEEVPPPQRQRLKKNWAEDPQEAKKALEDIFDGVVRERLKDILRQYEAREKHFDCVIRSKELEVLLSRARAEEQKQVAESERQNVSALETQCQQLRQQIEEMQTSQGRLMDKLISCCKEPTGERTQRLFAFLRDELEKRGNKVADGPSGG